MKDSAGSRGRRWVAALPWIGGGLAALAALVHIGLLLRIFGGRLGYPLDLEWMEGGMLGHALRVLGGQTLYAEPSADFISYLYTPFYPLVVATLGRVFGVGYLLGRVVSVLSFVAACGVAFAVVRREAEDRRRAWLWGLLAVGLIASTFPHTGAWYDLVRNDSLYLALISSALYLLRYHHQRLRWVAMAGLLLGLGFLTKQTSSVFILFAGAALLLMQWRRLLVLVPVVGLVAGGTVLALDRLTQGWFWRYVYKLHQGHDLYWDRIWPKTELKLLSLFPAVAAVLLLWCVVTVVRQLRERRWPDADLRRRLYWLALVLVGVAVSAIGFATQWAVENAYIPGFYFAAIFAGVAGADLARQAARSRRPWLLGLLVLGVGASLAAQLAAQLYRPAPHLPPAAWRAAGQRLLQRLRAVSGPILMPYHPFYPYLVGKAAGYHQMGINDVTRAGLPFPASIRQRVYGWYYGAIVLDTSPEHRADYDFILKAYKFSHYLQPDEAPGVVAGYRVRPCYVLEPKKASPPPPRGVRRVFDFESGTYAGWQQLGEAFGSGPAGGPSGNQRMAGPYEGRYLASSLVHGDRATGSLTSPDFVIDQPLLRYRVGGGNDPSRLQVRIVVDGVGEVHVGTGTRSHIMAVRTVDVSAQRGKRARVELVDRATGGWGHLLFDELTLGPR